MNRRPAKTILTGVFGVAVGGMFGHGCRYDDTDHCALEDGNEYCARKYGVTERTFCARGNVRCAERFPESDGCVATRPDDDACYSPCGEGKSFGEDAECDAIAEGSSSSDTLTTTETMTAASSEATTPTESTTVSESESSSSTTIGPACVESSECGDAAVPVCVNDVCVPCTSDAQCEAKDPDAPACDDGQCVVCTADMPSACGGTTPVCDDVANACVGCSFHEQCSENACRIATGGCFDPEVVRDVGPGMEFESIGDAVATLGEGGEVVLRVFAGADYNEAVTIGGAGTAYALLADDDEVVPQWVNTMGAASTLRVEDGAEVYVQSIRLTLNGAGAFPGITANAASLYLDRTRVVGNAGGGIVLAAGADGHLRNCFVGGDVNDVAALEATGASVDILFSTLGGGFGTAAALRCNAGATVHVRNSLLLARTGDPELDCTTDSLENSLTEAELDDMNINWFVPGGYAAGNFLLSGMAPAAILTAAQWQLGDPPTDIEGDLRPTDNGTPDVAGADVP